MNISITTIVVFILIGVFIQFATKFIFKLIGWVIVLLGGVYVLYHFGIGPFAKNPVNVVDLQTKYCVEEVDEDICDCVITPIRNDMNNRFSKEELSELEDKRGEALYVFQKSLSILTGTQGGWPLSMFLDENGVPFTGGTYFPPKEMHGRPDFRKVLNNVSEVYQNNREKIIAQAAQMQNIFSKINQRTAVLDQALLPFVDKIILKVMM